VIDFGGLDYIASAGLGVLNGQLAAVRKAGGDIRLCGMNAKVRKVFDVLGYSKIFKILADASQAAASF
jgi:anti-anti-sigma factor